MKPGSRIDQMFAFTAIDPIDNIEGVVSVTIGGTAMPLVGADMERIQSLRPLASEVARRLKQKITLKRFSEVSVIGYIDPT
jgi:hypothetical protein